MTIVLSDAGDFTVDATEGLRLMPDDAERITGWTLKPEGMCRGTVCVPLPMEMTSRGRIDLPAFWRHLGNPLLTDAAKEVWVLGAGAEERNASLIGLEAPDITLPDLAGVPHSLAALRGKKVLLTTWASW